jgi:DNA-binding FrmR family transcriptional regulator
MATTKNPEPCQCGCAIKAGTREAVGVDPEIKAANLARLKRAQGQVGGVLRMVADDRSCADIITQISAVRESLHAVARNLLKNHLRTAPSRPCEGTAPSARG